MQFFLQENLTQSNQILFERGSADKALPIMELNPMGLKDPHTREQHRPRQFLLPMGENIGQTLLAQQMYINMQHVAKVNITK